MPVDPRHRFDDLVVETTTEEVDAEEFDRRREMEAFQAGWVVVGAVFDADERLLLAFDGEDWLAPGGTWYPGETLEETLVREVREETEVRAEPIRPHTVTDVVVRGPDDRLGFTLVGYEARTTASTSGRISAGDDDEIEDAAFVEALPSNLYGGALLHQLLSRAEPSTWDPVPDGGASQ